MKSSPYLRKIPFLRLLVFFTGGILSGFLHQKPLVALMPLLITIMLLVALVLIIQRLTASMNSAFITSILLLFIMFLSGILSAYPAKIFQQDISSFPNPGTFIAVVSDLPEEKPSSIKAEIKVLAVRDSVIRTVKKFRALVYFQKSKAASELLPGTMICINSPLDDISPPQNPGEFNYKKYLANHGIYRQAYVPVNSWCTLPQKSHTLMTVSMLCRKQLTDKFRELPLSPDESAVLSAITLGYKSNVDSGVKESFTAAGVMHVMALSGFKRGSDCLVPGRNAVVYKG
jgi:competence protein ComEC